jgi:hypothetical protein
MAAGDEAVPGVRGPADRGRSRPRRGAGGRWLVWVFRGLVWAVLLLIGYRGVAAIVGGPSPASSAGPAAAQETESARGFPTALAEAYALQFGDAYLNFSPAAAAQRARALSAFLPPGTDSQLGWNGAGSQHLQAEQVASISVQGANRAIVTLLATVSGHLMELGVPIYSSGGALAVSGEPALLPPPAQATPPQPQGAAADPATQAALSTQLPPFFQAYASGDTVTLGRFLAPGVRLTGLGGLVTFSSIAQINVPSGGATRHITVTVVWQTVSKAAAVTGTAGTNPVAAAPATLQMTYEMTVVRHGSSWYVQAIGASTQLPGPP